MCMICDLFFQLDQALVKLIVTENLSIRLVDSIPLKNLLELVARREIKMPSRGSFVKCLATNYDRMKTNMIQMLSEQTKVNDIHTGVLNIFVIIT